MDLETRTAKVLAEENLSSDAEIVIMAQRGVMQHNEWELKHLEVKYRYSEYNYAGVMLRDAQDKLKAHEAKE